MICKYCGKEMNFQDAVCPNCHNPASPLTGGNGFWDMASAPAASGAAPVPPEQTPPAPPQKSRHVFLAAMACISLILSICTLATCLLLNSKLHRQAELLCQLEDTLDRRDVQMQMNPTVPTEAEVVQSTEDDASTRPSLRTEIILDAEIQPDDEFPLTTSPEFFSGQALQIIKISKTEPDFVQIDISETDHTITCSSSHELEFKWMLQVDDDSWIPVGLTENLRPADDGSRYYSCLSLEASEEECGIYRCDILSRDKVIHTARFIVSLIPDDASIMD